MEIRNVSRRVGVAAAATILVLWGLTTFATRPLQARQGTAEEPAGGFTKLGKYYVNLGLVTHIIDDPGPNLPPGSIQVFFSGGPAPNSVNLFGDEANALRKALGQPEIDPAAEPSAKPAKVAVPKPNFPKKATAKKKGPNGGSFQPGTGDPGL